MMNRLGREEIAELVRSGLVDDLLVKKFRRDADFRKELRVDEDDLTDMAYDILVKLGVVPESIDTNAYEGQVNTPGELVGFLLWCTQR